VKTVRTVTVVEERDEKIDARRAFNKGDYLEIYNGPREGCCFKVADVRFNHDLNQFEYLDAGFCGGWYHEKGVIKA
jgi:hypothetical protein